MVTSGYEWTLVCCKVAAGSVLARNERFRGWLPIPASYLSPAVSPNSSALISDDTQPVQSLALATGRRHLPGRCQTCCNKRVNSMNVAVLAFVGSRAVIAAGSTSEASSLSALCTTEALVSAASSQPPCRDSRFARRSRPPTAADRARPHGEYASQEHPDVPPATGRSACDALAPFGHPCSDAIAVALYHRSSSTVDQSA